MKLGTIGCLIGSAAAMLFGGCASDPYATTTTDTQRDTYRGAFRTATTVDPDERYAVQSSEPVFVEDRTITMDNRSVQVPVYRTGNEYFYTYGGRRVAVEGGTTVRRTTGVRATSRASYRSALQRERPVVKTGYTEER